MRHKWNRTKGSNFKCEKCGCCKVDRLGKIRIYHLPNGDFIGSKAPECKDYTEQFNINDEPGK